MAQNWEIDPKKGDYVMDGGKPVETDSLKVPAYFRLKVQRGKWLYAPDENYGSDFHSVAKRQTSRDATALENMAARALQPMADDGRADLIEVETKVTARHGLGFDITIESSEGQKETMELPPLGG